VIKITDPGFLITYAPVRLAIRSSGSRGVIAMRKTITILLILVTVALAKKKPDEYPLTAKVISVDIPNGIAWTTWNLHGQRNPIIELRIGEEDYFASWKRKCFTHIYPLGSEVHVRLTPNRIYLQTENEHTCSAAYRKEPIWKSGKVQ
jgi:hypothetical protein